MSMPVFEHVGGVREPQLCAPPRNIFGKMIWNRLVDGRKRLLEELLALAVHR